MTKVYVNLVIERLPALQNVPSCYGYRYMNRVQLGTF